MLNRDRTLSLLAVPAALALGGLIAINPILGLTAAGAIAIAVILYFSSRGRLVVVLLGGLLVFQSNDDLGPAKYAYLAAAVVAVTISLIRLSRSDQLYTRWFRPLLFGSILMVLVLSMSAFVAAADGTSLTSWARDASSYFFVVCLPAVALDAARDFTKKQLEALIVILGVAAAAGFAIDWMSRRHVSSLGFGRIILSTTTLVALAFAYALVRVAAGPHRARWITLCTVIIAMMMVSGSRTNLVLLAAILGIIGTTAKARVPMHRLVIQVGFVGLLAVASVPILGEALTNDPHFLDSRIRATKAIFAGNFAGDASFQERAQSYAVAKAEFVRSPVFGVGPGHAFPTGSSYSNYSASLDTPWLIPAKFGIVGVVALILFFVSLLACMARLRRDVGWLDIITAGRAWFAILLFLTPFGPWIEDKGFAMALALYIAALAASARQIVSSRDATVLASKPAVSPALR